MNPSLHTFDLVMSKHKEVQLEVLRLKLPTNTNIYSSILKYGSILIFTWDKRFINLTFRLTQSEDNKMTYSLVELFLVLVKF